jgi:hypothetical protein
VIPATFSASEFDHTAHAADDFSLGTLSEKVKGINSPLSLPYETKTLI